MGLGSLEVDTEDIGGSFDDIVDSLDDIVDSLDDIEDRTAESLDDTVSSSAGTAGRIGSSTPRRGTCSALDRILPALIDVRRENPPTSEKTYCSNV